MNQQWVNFLSDQTCRFLLSPLARPQRHLVPGHGLMEPVQLQLANELKAHAHSHLNSGCASVLHN